MIDIDRGVYALWREWQEENLDNNELLSDVSYEAV